MEAENITLLRLRASYNHLRNMGKVHTQKTWRKLLDGNLHIYHRLSMAIPQGSLRVLWRVFGRLIHSLIYNGYWGKMRIC